RHIAPNIKQLVLRMNDDPNMTQTRICELTGVSECTQYHIAALLHETGEVVCTPLVAGHPQKLDVLDSAASFLEGCIEKQPDILLAELQTRLWEVCEVDVSLNTIKETLRHRGFT
ncbi:hypothetical protein L208DRAFT_1268986, partial [Tricholoma matsutake]